MALRYVDFQRGGFDERYIAVEDEGDTRGCNKKL